MTNLTKLTQLGTPAMSRLSANQAALAQAFGQSAATELAALLGIRNGFYAFEGALHVFPDARLTGELGVLDWNQDSLWRASYERMADGAIYFAEDAFGGQFCLREGAVCTFEPETGTFAPMARDLEQWAGKILSDYPLYTGFPLAHEWQVIHGTIPIGSRLIPVTPFVLGGEFCHTNLRAMDAVKAMNYRASIAIQIRDLPDGATVTLKVVD